MHSFGQFFTFKAQLLQKESQNNLHYHNWLVDDTKMDLFLSRQFPGGANEATQADSLVPFLHYKQNNSRNISPTIYCLFMS